jgi:hypothetical protein
MLAIDHARMTDECFGPRLTVKEVLARARRRGSSLFLMFLAFDLLKEEQLKGYRTGYSTSWP